MSIQRHYGFTESEFVLRFRVAYVLPEYLDQLQSSGHDLSYSDLLSLIESGCSSRRIRFAPPNVLTMPNGVAWGLRPSVASRNSSGTGIFSSCPYWDRLYMPFDFHSPCHIIVRARRAVS